MRSVVSRLARLEQLNRLHTGPKRTRIERGYLKKLPDDYIGAPACRYREANTAGGNSADRARRELVLNGKNALALS